MTPLAWCLILMILGLGLLVLEVFVPSGGILGLCSVASVLASIVLAYYHYGLYTGTAFLAAGAVSVPVVMVAAVKFWPNTPFGRLILIPLPKRDDAVLRDNPHTAELKSLVGRRGTARSPMLPAGAVQIEGKTYDAVSQGGAIDLHDPVQVVGLSGPSLLVRKLTAAELAPAPAAPSKLDEPVDAVLDPFRDPPA